jgi:hypothetical protein
MCELAVVIAGKTVENTELKVKKVKKDIFVTIV